MLNIRPCVNDFCISNAHVTKEEIFLYVFLAGLKIKFTLDRLKGENQSLIICKNGREPEELSKFPKWPKPSSFFFFLILIFYFFLNFKIFNSNMRSQTSMLQIMISLVAQWLRICLQCKRPGFSPWVGKIPWRRKWQPTPVFLSGKFLESGA